MRDHRLHASVLRLLESRHWDLLILVLALALTTPYLLLGGIGDDDFHAVATRSNTALSGVRRNAFELFSFATPDTNQLLMEDGLFPWWTDRELLIAFYRPLSSLTTWLDYRLWPDTPPLMHLQSMLWFALLLTSVRLVYRRLSLSPRHSALALLIYAVDDARSMPVAWLAQRNALIALTPAFLTLLLHHRARRTGAARDAWLASLLLLLGLQGGEAALAACGYLVAYALVLDRAPRAARVRSLLPYLAVLLLWGALYHCLGHGALHSGIYVDPGREPLAFARVLCERLPILLLGQFALPFSDLWEGYPMMAAWLKPAVWAFALGLFAYLYYLVRPLLQAHPLLRFWLLGSLLATIPACAVHPEDRMLTATSLGSAQLIASLLLAVLEHSRLGQTLGLRVAAIAMFVIHLVLAPLLLPLRSFDVYAMRVAMARADQSLSKASRATQDTIVLLNPPLDVFAVYFPVFREARGLPLPRRFRWLATGESDLRVTHVDERTLKLRPADGFLASSTQCMFRRADRRFQPEERVALRGVEITIAALTEDGRPQEVVVRFDAPLEGGPYRFFRWGEHEYQPFRLPSVGSSVLLPRVELGDVFGTGASRAEARIPRPPRADP